MLASAPTDEAALAIGRRTLRGSDWDTVAALQIGPAPCRSDLIGYATIGIAVESPDAESLQRDIDTHPEFPGSPAGICTERNIVPHAAPMNIWGETARDYARG